MPIYEYKCKCGHKGEAMRPAEERHTLRCAKCGNTAKLKISLANFKMSHSFKVFDESLDRVTAEKQTTERTPIQEPGRQV